MNYREGMSAEDFLIQNSFQHYCAGRDEACIKYWENYLSLHPEQMEHILEAKRLYFILNGSKKPLNKNLVELEYKLLKRKKSKISIISNLAKKAAVIVSIVSLGFIIYWNQYTTKNELNAGIIESEILFTKTYQAQNGERKKLKLPDGTTVLLNAGSKLYIDKNFDGKIRIVKLDGEGFFDVVHNKTPFIVQTKDFNVKVLGTKFNVKSYDSDSFSETALVAGSIQLELINRKNEILALKPGEKLSVRNVEENNKSNKDLLDNTIEEIRLSKNTITDNNEIVETAWTNNKIEIQAQNFADIKGILERWYKVKILFQDPKILEYKYTAVFTTETIDEVMSALQNAKHFNFTKKDNTIIITK